MIKVTLSDGSSIEVICPKVKAFKAASKKTDEVDQSITLLSAATNMTPDEIDDLPLNDYMLLQEAVNSFLPKAAQQQKEKH